MPLYGPEFDGRLQRGSTSERRPMPIFDEHRAVHQLYLPRPPVYWIQRFGRCYSLELPPTIRLVRGTKGPGHQPHRLHRRGGGRYWWLVWASIDVYWQLWRQRERRSCGRCRSTGDRADSPASNLYSDTNANAGRGSIECGHVGERQQRANESYRFGRCLGYFLGARRNDELGHLRGAKSNDELGHFLAAKRNDDLRHILYARLTDDPGRAGAADATEPTRHDNASSNVADHSYTAQACRGSRDADHGLCLRDGYATTTEHQPATTEAPAGHASRQCGHELRFLRR